MISRILFLITIIYSSLLANSAVVFMYHRFGESTYPSTNITMQQFEYQLGYLQQNHYNVWHLSKIINYLKDNRELPPKTVALTIDDAYISTYTKAFPLLRAKRFPFTVMVSTNPVDNQSKNYMTWNMMREMQRYGAEFTNHSASHEYLLQQKGESKYKWEKRFIKEVEKAQERLQQELGYNTNENPRLFSYPFGEYDEHMKELLKQLGYYGITQTSGPIDGNSDLMQISRFPMSEIFATPDGFTSKLNTTTLPIKFISFKKPTYENPPVLNIELHKPVKNLNCFLSNGDAINVNWLSDTMFQAYAKEKLQPPREKYTCTAQAQNEKWHWYSHLWIVK